jgi:oxepin-CoA hydrolase/3-oxo-5,6-dehydrosuberyl-CoA semialdehyde dehydrogenase
MEADSLNCCVLGDDVTPEQPEFALFIREVVREMTAKAGQKCTAIRRIIVPQAQVKAVSDALIARLQNVVVGDPAQEGVKMGALVNYEQRQDVQDNVNRLVAAGCDVLLGARPISAPPGPSSRQRCCSARSRMKPRRYTPLKRLVPSQP